MRNYVLFNSVFVYSRLFTPEKVKRKTIESESPCPHKGKCEKYVAKVS